MNARVRPISIVRSCTEARSHHNLVVLIQHNNVRRSLGDTVAVANVRHVEAPVVPRGSLEDGKTCGTHKHSGVGVGGYNIAESWKRASQIRPSL